MTAVGPDLYETLEIHYPPTTARAPTPAMSSWAPGTILAVATAVVLVLGAALAVLITLHLQGQAELKAAQAELAALGDPRLPDPSGLQNSKSQSALQHRKDQLGRWLQGLLLGWRYHDGMIYFFSAERKPWADAEAACRSMHAHLTSITSREEQDYLAREARGGSYWIGLMETETEGSWQWVDGAAYNPSKSFWAKGQPDNSDHGKWGSESCTQIHHVGNGLWNDHNCNFTFHWVCKRPLTPP